MSDRDGENERGEDDPWESPVEHPGKKYERLAERYESGEPDDELFSGGLLGDSEPSGAVHADVSPKLQTRFWLLVLVFNGALFGLSVGAMFIVFESDWTLGPQLMVGGGILFVYGFYRYRKVRRRLQDGKLGSDRN